MKIRTFRSLENGKYRVTKTTEDFSELDNQLMAKFGEPEVDLGGSFGTNPPFTVDSDLERIATGSPFTRWFDTRDYDLEQQVQIEVKSGAAVLNGDYFDVYAGATGYRVWIDENNTGVAPVSGGLTLVEIDVAAAATAAAVAAALIAQLPGSTTFSVAAGSSSTLLTLTSPDVGTVDDPDQGTTDPDDLELTVLVQGDSALRRADAWDVEISSRLTQAMLDLRLFADTFTGERVENV